MELRDNCNNSGKKYWRLGVLCIKYMFMVSSLISGHILNIWLVGRTYHLAVGYSQEWECETKKMISPKVFIWAEQQVAIHRDSEPQNHGSLREIKFRFWHALFKCLQHIHIVKSKNLKEITEVVSVHKGKKGFKNWALRTLINTHYLEFRKWRKI